MDGAGLLVEGSNLDVPVELGIFLMSMWPCPRLVVLTLIYVYQGTESPTEPHESPGPFTFPDKRMPSLLLLRCTANASPMISQIFTAFASI